MIRQYFYRKIPSPDMKCCWHTHRYLFKCKEKMILQRLQNEIENNTWTPGDMEFIFECSHRYRTSERSERVRYPMWTREDKFHISSVHVLFCLYSVYYINILITMFLTTFWRFPTTFRRFPKIFQNCSEGLTNVSEDFRNIFRRLPKIAEGSRRFPRKYRWCFDHTTPPMSTF